MKKESAEALFRQMLYCPMCGGVVTRFGGLSSEMKRCDNNCGIMYLKGWKQNTKVGMFLEIDVEKLPS